MLADTACRNARPKPSPYKMSDGYGLYLLVTPTGSKLWQMAYRFGDRQRKLSFGAYPAVGLADARRQRDQAKALIAKGIDPSEAKKQARRERAAARTFTAWADAWLAKQHAEGCKERTLKSKRRFVGYLKNEFGPAMIADITRDGVVQFLRKFEQDGTLETRDRVRAAGESICVFADLKGTGANPFRDLGALLIKNKAEPRPALTAPAAVAQLFQDIAAPLQHAKYGDLVGYALRLLSLTAMRPGEVNRAEWTEIDWEKARWTIPADKMKMDKEHVVPLSRQALAILKAIQALTGHRRYIFSSTQDRPLSDNTLNKRLRVIGYDTISEHCAHGFRSTFSTLCHQEVDRDDNKLWDSDVVELCLAHRDEDSVKAIYNKVGPLALIGPRTKLMQHWADRIDAMVDTDKVIAIDRPIRKRRGL
jgi:integrase